MENAEDDHILSLVNAQELKELRKGLAKDLATYTRKLTRLVFPPKVLKVSSRTGTVPNRWKNSGVSAKIPLDQSKLTIMRSEFSNWKNIHCKLLSLLFMSYFQNMLDGATHNIKRLNSMTCSKVPSPVSAMVQPKKKNATTSHKDVRICE